MSKIDVLEYNKYLVGIELNETDATVNVIFNNIMFSFFFCFICNKKFIVIINFILILLSGIIHNSRASRSPRGIKFTNQCDCNPTTALLGWTDRHRLQLSV